jgi:hypothetical protein
MALLPTNAYTVNGTTLTFASAPALGVNNIDVRAPSLLVGAASTAASLAQVYAANALTSQTAAAISASSAAGYAAARNQWTFSTTTTMADPATANLRLNNASFASVTAIAISDLSANVGNPDLSGWISTWDDAGGSNRGSIFIFKDNGNFAIYNVNSALIDNTTWFQVPVTHVSSAGSFSASDALLIGFSAAGTTLVSGGITQLTGDVIASGAGSVVATIANSAVTNAKMATGSVTPDRLSTGGIYWDASGNVGIGTTTLGSNDFLVSESKPAGQVQASIVNVDTGGTSGSYIFASQGAVQTLLSSYGNSFGQTGTATGSNHPFIFLTNGVERGRFDTSGNFLFNSGYGSVATAYGCRAWVNFNGQGTVAIRASGNVSSITDIGSGQFTVNFTTAMPDANYSVVAAAARHNDSLTDGAFSTSSVTVICRNNSDIFYDPLFFCVAIFR